MNNCPNCGNQVNPESKFCPNCGTSTDLNRKKFCIKCGNEMNMNSNFCSNCGSNQNVNTQNINPQTINYQNVNIQNNNKATNIYTLLLIAIITSVVACFLPIVDVLGISINFVYNYGQVADGVLIIIIQVVAFILLLCKKRIPVMVLQIINVFVFIYDVGNLFDKTSGEIFSFLGIGFYLLTVSLIGSIVFSIMRVAKKDMYK